MHFEERHPSGQKKNATKCHVHAFATMLVTGIKFPNLLKNGLDYHHTPGAITYIL